MWSCDSSTIRLGAMPKQLDVHDLHKLSCQHPTQIQLIFNSTSETANYQQQTPKKTTDQHKNTRTDLRQARSRKAWQRKAGRRTRPRETGRRKRKHSGLNLRLHTMKKTSVQSHTKNNMYLYRYICKFLKECGALVRVALSAEALGADSLLSIWDQRLGSDLNAYNSRFVVCPTGTSKWDKHNLSQWDKQIGSVCTCPSGTSTTCPSGTSILEQVVFVPVGQAGWLYQTWLIGTRRGQKRPLRVSWHTSYTHDGGLSVCHGTSSIPRWSLYLFHLCQLVPQSGSTRPWKIRRWTGGLSKVTRGLMKDKKADFEWKIR